MGTEQFLDDAVASYLRLGDNDDLLVFEQHVHDALDGIAERIGKLTIIEDAKRHVQHVAREASNDADDRVRVLLDMLDRQRESLDRSEA